MGNIILWDADDGFPTRSITAQADSRGGRKVPGVLAAHYSRAGTILTSGRDGSARIWAANGTQLAKFEGFKDLPTKVAFSHDGARVFIGDFTGAVTVWGVQDKQPLATLNTLAK